jgi:hypothetical protein
VAFPGCEGTPPGKLADAELHFSSGLLDWLKFIGFAHWQDKNGGRHRPHPGAAVLRERRASQLALLRPIVDATSQDRVHDLILEAYKEHEAALAATG